MKEVSVEIDGVVYNKLQELEDKSELIIVASPVKDFHNRTSKSTTLPDGTLQDFASFNEVKIDKVLKAPNDFDKNAKTIEVAEPVAYVKKGNNTTKFSKEGYIEMKKKSKYLIYLSKNAIGTYSVHGLSGRFNIDGTDADDTNPKIDEGHKLKLRKEAETKYPELFTSNRI